MPKTEFDSFSNLVGKVLSVSKEELKRRNKLYQREAAKNPNRQGPEPKRWAEPSILLPLK